MVADSIEKRIKIAETNNMANRKVIFRGGLDNRADIYANYWYTIRGDFWISGGTKSDSLETLIPAICWNRDLSERPTIVFTSRTSVIKELIANTRTGILDRNLYVFSSENRNYQFLEGMDEGRIEHFLCEIARTNSIDNLGDFSRFCGDFMKILKAKYEVSMASMVSLAAYDNADIINFARNVHISNNTITSYDNRKDQLENLKKVLKSFSKEIVDNNLSTKDCESHRNIKKICEREKNAVIVVSISATSHYLYKYFRYELEELSNYNLVIDNLSFNKKQDEEFLEYIKGRMASTNGVTGLCLKDIIGVIGDENVPENQVVFSHGLASETEKYTGLFGKYEKESVDETTQTPIVNFWDSLFMTAEERRRAKIATQGIATSKEWVLRVTAVDLAKFKAALAGHYGDFVELVI